MAYEIQRVMCNVMPLGGQNTGHGYNMNGKPLDELKSGRDLAVIISHDLRAFEQCQQAYYKANSVLGVLKRSITITCKPDTVARGMDGFKLLWERANFAPLQSRNHCTNQYQILNK